METNEYIGDLKEFIQKSSHDFLKVLKVFSVKSRAKKLPCSITEKLQYFDIITQRLQHLVDTHEKVMTLYVDEIFKESFLRLQYLQFSTIAFDLSDVTSFINFHLNEEDDQNAIGSQTDNLIFGNTEGLSAVCEKIKRTLKADAGDIRLIGMAALTRRQIAICRQLYTMESERVVLDWYITNSAGEFSEFLKIYQSWLQGNNNPTIEIFDNV
jgi:hypothetical protein